MLRYVHDASAAFFFSKGNKYVSGTRNQCSLPPQLRVTIFRNIHT